MAHFGIFPLLVLAGLAIKACMVGAWVQMSAQRRAQLAAIPRRRFAYTSSINGRNVRPVNQYSE